MRLRVHTRTAIGLAIASALVLAAAPVLAGTRTTLASAPSPFAACTVGGPGTNFVNAEVEPRVAVNPQNPNNIIGVYQQDRWSNGGAHGLVTAVSVDGGQTWAHNFPHFSTCAGGTAANGGGYDRSSDPWVTFAPNGDAFQISLSFSADQTTSAVLVSKSTNMGASWSEPTTLISETSSFSFNDKESITADPTQAGYVYAVWDRSRFPSDNADINALHSFAFRGDIMFSRTTNGGATWEAPRRLNELNSNVFTIGNMIVVLPDGTLVDVFEQVKGSGVQGSTNPFTESVIRSTDHGATWSKSITISSDQSVAVRDPDTGARVRAGAGLPDAAVDRSTGAIYVVWADGRFSGGAHDDIALSKSTDGGLTWSGPVKVNRSPLGVAAFTPSVAVAANGTVAVTYYDFRNNTSAPGALTDHWIIASADGGATWAEQRLTATSFDIETAPVAGGYFLGDYDGLATMGNDFAAFASYANTGNVANRTDIYFTRVTVP
jgi:hypothetical protein